MPVKGGLCQIPLATSEGAIRFNKQAPQFSRVPQLAVANSSEEDGRIAMWYHCLANLTVHLLKVSDALTAI